MKKRDWERERKKERERPDCRPQPIHGAGYFIHSSCLDLPHAAPPILLFTQIDLSPGLIVVQLVKSC